MGERSINNPSQVDRHLLSLLKKEKSHKTVFNLTRGANEHIKKLARKGFVTMKDVIDVLAKTIEQRDAEGSLNLVDFNSERERKSFTISEEARKTFDGLARKYKTSRDKIIETSVSVLMGVLDEMRLTAKDKIRDARILLDAVRRMQEIWAEAEVATARERLMNAEDTDFGPGYDDDTCGDYINDVDRMDYLPDALEDFIRAKENDLAEEKGEAAN